MKVNNSKRAFGKSVDDWQWAWYAEKIVLQDRWKKPAVELCYGEGEQWHWRVDAGSPNKAANFFFAVDEALKQHDLPWPVHEELRMIAATEYERLRIMYEEYAKLLVRG